MTRLIILVEGQTEEAFCKRVLYPWLDDYEEKAGPTKLNPGGLQQGRAGRGGHAHSFSVMKRDLERTLGSRFDVVTTMFDLYHLPSDFPGMAEAVKIPDPIKRAEYLERALLLHMGSPKGFVPNLLVHEFEALLFANPSVLEETVYLPPGVRKEMCAVAKASPSPEHINHDEPPGVRLAECAKRHGGKYMKPIQGPQIAEQIGIEAMRSQCKHFDAWVTKLRSLA